MKIKIKIYIAGKVRGLKRERAVKLFNDAEIELTKLGFDVINPITLDHSNDITWEDYLRTDIPELCKCQCIYVLSNYKTSKGAKLEMHIAKNLNIKFIYQLLMNV